MEKVLAAAAGLLAGAALLTVLVAGAPAAQSVIAADTEGSARSSVTSWDWPK